MKLYGNIASPFVRKVALTLKYKKLAYESIHMSPKDIDESISPLKKIPALVDDGITLCDSSVICDYLEQKYPNTASVLSKLDIPSRAKALWFEEYADSKIFNVLIMGIFVEKVLAPKLFNRPTNETVLNKALEEAPQVLSYLNNSIKDQYLAGNTVSIADFATVSMFINYQYAGEKVDENKYPNLTSYLTRMCELDEVKQCLEEEKIYFEKVGF